MSYPEITFTYAPPTGADVVITVPRPEFGNGDGSDPQQEVKRSRGGQIYILSSGPVLRQFHWVFSGLNVAQRADLDKFFSSRYVNKACKWFKAAWEPTQYEIVRVGATTGGSRPTGKTWQPRVGGAVIKCGQFTVGQRILMESISFYVRLITPKLDFTEDEDGLSSVEMTVEVINGFLPDNAC